MNLAEKQKSGSAFRDQDHLVCLFWAFIHEHIKDISALSPFEIDFFMKELMKKYKIEDLDSIILEYEADEELEKKPEINFEKIRSAIEVSAKDKGKS